MSPSREARSARKVALARKIAVILHRMWGRRRNLPMDCSRADCRTDLINEQHETPAGRTQALLSELPSPGRWMR